MKNKTVKLILFIVTFLIFSTAYSYAALDVGLKIGLGFQNQTKISGYEEYNEGQVPSSTTKWC